MLEFSYQWIFNLLFLVFSLFYRRFKIRFFLNTKRTTIIAHFKIRKRGKYTLELPTFEDMSLYLQCGTIYNVSFFFFIKFCRFEYLHEKLSHIKKLVSDFDTQLTNSNEGGDNGMSYSSQNGSAKTMHAAYWHCRLLLMMMMII